MVLAISIFIVLIINNFFSYKKDNFTDEKFIVHKKTDSYFYIKNKSGWFLLFKKEEDFDLGDELTINGTFKQFEKIQKNLYFKSERIKGIVIAKNISVSNSYFSFQKLLNDYVENKGNYYKKYFLLLTFGFHSTSSENVFDLSKNLGIIHLLIISGFHFNLIFGIFKALFKKLKFKNYEVLALILITIYYILIAKNSSTFRAYFSILIVVLVKLKFKQNVKGYAPFIVGILAIIINPYIVVRQGFWYSYIISIFIFNFNKILKKYKSKYLRLFFLSISIYVVSLIISLIFKNNINIFGYFNIILLTPVCEFLIINNLFFWWFVPYIDFMYKIFEYLLVILNYTSLIIEPNIRINFIFRCILFYLLHIFMNFFYFKNRIKNTLN